MSFEFGAWMAAEGAAGDALAALNRTNATIRRQNARIEELEAELAVAKANTAGRLAQFEAFEAMHPASPLLSDSGVKFANGTAKTKARLIFERIFDETARKLGIASPAAFRNN